MLLISSAYLLPSASWICSVPINFAFTVSISTYYTSQIVFTLRSSFPLVKFNDWNHCYFWRIVKRNIQVVVLSINKVSNFCVDLKQMSSDGPTHNEFDFEFLGNTTGEPYTVQTNVYVNGVGNREQRLNLWFDPSKDFHTYTIFWNQRQVV